MSLPKNFINRILSTFNIDFMKSRYLISMAAGVALTLGGSLQAAPPRLMQTAPAGKAAAAAQIPRLKGNVLYSDAWSQQEQTNGIYYLPTNAGELFELIHAGYYGTFGNFEQGGYYFTTERVMDNMLYKIMHTVWDATTGGFVNSFIITADCSTVAVDCAKDPTSGQIYAATFDFNGYNYQLSVLDFTRESAKATKIGKFDCEIAALACTSKGQLYAISREHDAEGRVTGSILLKVNKADGSYEKVGTGTGCLPYYNSSATIDPATDRMYWTVCPHDESGSLYEVDLTTGKASLIYTFPNREQVVGLETAGAAAADKAPATPVNLRIAFDGGSLSGTLTCDVPAYTFDGKPASGQVAYTILIDEKQQGQGTIAYGGSISHPITVDETGTHTFTVYTTNSAGNSPKTSAKVFAGYGQPAAPQQVRAEWADGNMTLRWAPVISSVDGGYLDVDGITYNVRASDGNLLAEGIKETSWTCAVPEPATPTAYRYMVSAVSGGRYSEASRSNTVSLGALTPPFSTVFSQGSQTLNGYTVIDSNNDGRTWIWDEKGHGVRAPYNTDHVTPMDDWLITPALKLKAGNAYDLTFDASVMDATCDETFEVKLGTANSAESMNVTLIPSTTIANTTPKTYTARIIPSADGNYFVGLHCISAADRYYLFVDNLSVGAAQISNAPDKPADFKVTPDASGAYQTDIELKAPSTNIHGEPVGSLTKVVVERDGVSIHTFNAPAPGATLTYTDKPGKNGRYTYSAAAYNADGRGIAVTADVVIGIDVPAQPTGISVKETSNLGEVKATWERVTTDCKGYSIPADKVTYDVYMLSPYTGEWELKASALTDNTYTLRTLKDIEEQDFAYLAVAARTEGGASEMLKADPVAVGNPYPGLSESVPDCRYTYNWAMDGTCSAFGTFYDNSIRSCSSYDGDNGYFFMRADALGQYAYLQSGKVKLTGDAPVLSFYTYDLSKDDSRDINGIAVGLKVCGSDDEFRPLLDTTVAELAGYAGTPGWVRCEVPLDRYAGKDVELRITGTVSSYSYIMLDNIYVGSPIEKDLAITGVNAPSRVKAGANFDIEVTVLNNGVLDAGNWSLDLYEGDEVIKTKDIRALKAGESYTATFNMQMSPIATEAAEYYVRVELAGDENMYNNESDSFTITPVVANHPRANGLTAESTEDGISLKWTAPELLTQPETLTEDFETADSFAHDYADWTFADRDDVEVGGFNEFSIPGIVNTETKSSFFVFEPKSLNLPSSQFGARSGEKYLVSLMRWDDGQVDDWAISPELSGNAQTVTFYARSFQSAYPEKVEVLYSTTTADPADFKVINAAVEVPAAWTEYTASLPQGAKYFAIRSCASGNFMLMVDDVTYEAKALADKYSIAGYNVYCNGVKVNDTPVNGTTYLDANREVGRYEYVVTAVYNLGESGPSNVADIDTTGLEAIDLEQDGDTVYYNLQGIRVVHPSKGGIYIRQRGTVTDKVIIR